METTSHPTAQLVGNAFVEQYYPILHHSPELAYHFYQDSSVVSRLDSKGVMTSVTTMQGINEKILSINFKVFKVEIKTVDAQKSYKKGVTVLLTGCLTSKDNLTRSFAQSFFLAPQNNGYYVLNDVFRYLEDYEPSKLHLVNGDGGAATVTIIAEPGPSHGSDLPTLTNSHVNKDQIFSKNAYEPSSHHERQMPIENEAIIESHVQSNGNDDSQATKLDSSVQEDASKKSYASIVKVRKRSLGSAKIYMPTNTIKARPNKTKSQIVKPMKTATMLEAPPNSVRNTKSGDNHEEGDGHSIYIRNLPLNVTAAQLEVEFKKFGPIKPRGIHVRNNKQQGYCFGFVEFQSLSSMNNAIQASLINFAGRHTVVEMKRTTTRVGSGTSSTRGARTSSRKGGFRNDNYRSRGNYGGGRGYGRNDYESHGEFSGRDQGHGGHGEGFQQGRGKGGQSSAPKPNVVSN